MCYSRMLFIALLAGFWSWPIMAEDNLSVIYPRQQGRAQETSYPYQLLGKALEKSGMAFTLSLSETEMTEEEARRLLIAGDSRITVASMGTNKYFEELMLPVRIPAAGGLFGYRLFLIHRQQQPTFSLIENVGQLKNLIAGQGIGWSDIAILEQAGLSVQANDYDKLFNMVQRKRIDYFPRGANEIFAEFDRFRTVHPDLAIEKQLMLVYPFAVLFFVNESDTKLHSAIETGLKTMHQDGSFVEFFRSHPTTAQTLEKANFSQRKSLIIANPLLSPATNHIPSQYWFNETWLKP